MNEFIAHILHGMRVVTSRCSFQPLSTTVPDTHSVVINTLFLEVFAQRLS